MSDTLIESGPSGRQRRVTRHRVRDHIVQMILTRRYDGGDKLVQQDLANELGVSRGVVREALFELQGTGIIDTSDNRGASVSIAYKDIVLEAFEIREALEGVMARRCCDHITRKQLRELSQLAHEAYELGSSGRRAEASKIDRQLHLRLMEIAGNHLLSHLSRSFWFVSKAVGERKHDPEGTLRSHLAVLEAIGSGDPDQAERAMRAHIRRGRGEVEAAMAEQADAVQWIAGRPANAKPDSESLTDSNEDGA
jgi:DNA-binding GntR family transcriptional regulator